MMYNSTSGNLGQTKNSQLCRSVSPLRENMLYVGRLSTQLELSGRQSHNLDFCLPYISV